MTSPDHRRTYDFNGAQSPQREGFCYNPAMENTLNVALKEWDALCTALVTGRQAILLRKGGIHEAAGEFELEHSRFLLFPTFLHQKIESVKPRFQGLITPAAAEPQTVIVSAFCEVRLIRPVPSREAFDALDDLHMWTPPFVDLRFGYRPGYPLYLIVVETFRLPAPVAVPNTPAYAGCKSWVPLAQPVNVEGSVAVLPPDALRRVVQSINDAFDPH